MRKMFFCIICLMAFFVIFSGLALAQNKHETFVKSYAGTESCSMCHKNSAKEMAESLHYLQLGEPRFLANWPKGKLAGMMDTF
jgi:nitrate/TMAO reductase-like tetraheme cytochrome c subunit